MATAKHRAIDLLRRDKRLERKHARSGPSTRRGTRWGRAGPGRGPRRRHRRRPPAAGLHGLPPGPADRGPRRTDAAAARRADDRRDRPGVPRPGADGRPADRPRQADAGREAGPVRGAPRGRTGRAAVVGAGGHLPDLQRGLHGDRRRRLDAAGAVRGGPATRADPGRSWPRGSRRSTGSSR